MWFKITKNQTIIRVATCYFFPQNAPNLTRKGTLTLRIFFVALKKYIVVYNGLGEVILIGDFNARTKNIQALNLKSKDKEKDDLLWLEEEDQHLWERISQDSKHNVMHYKDELLGICSLFNLVICNGMRAWTNLGNITCKTYNGKSVVDYVIYRMFTHQR